LKTVEKLLQRFVVSVPADWDNPWGEGDGTDYPSGRIPAMAWQEMIVRRVAAGE
jgi:hypothetical protein